MVLIPKVDSHKSLREFLPISFIGSLYKCVFKVFASRLTSVMDKTIEINQSSFLKGRKLLDGLVAVNEVVDLAKNLT